MPMYRRYTYIKKVLLHKVTFSVLRCRAQTHLESINKRYSTLPIFRFSYKRCTIHNLFIVRQKSAWIPRHHSKYLDQLSREYLRKLIYIHGNIRAASFSHIQKKNNTEFYLHFCDVYVCLCYHVYMFYLFMRTDRQTIKRTYIYIFGLSVAQTVNTAC